VSRVIQPSVAKRIAFATWARKAGVAKTSSATFVVPDDVEVPEALMKGAQVDGKVPVEKKPTTRRRKRAVIGPVSEPSPPQESYVQRFEHLQSESENQEE
jgi:hypothetical protein